MADAQDSDSCPFSGGVGSSPIFRSKIRPRVQNKVFLVFLYIKPFCLENNIGKEKKKKIKKIKRKEKSFVEYI